MTAHDALEETLAAVMQAARQGRLGELGKLAQVLERQIQDLLKDPPDEDRLRGLRAAATEASAFLEATLRGVAAARARLAEIRAVRSGAGTYGDDGQRRRLTLPGRDSRRL